MIKQFKPFKITRPWGNFRQFSKNTTTTIKILTVKPNEMLSLQNHKHRSEFWHVISGSGQVEVNGIWKKIKKGSELSIPLKIKHRLSASDLGLELLEISYGDFDEADITHFEDKYGRK